MTATERRLDTLGGLLSASAYATVMALVVLFALLLAFGVGRWTGNTIQVNLLTLYLTVVVSSVLWGLFVRRRAYGAVKGWLTRDEAFFERACEGYLLLFASGTSGQLNFANVAPGLRCLAKKVQVAHRMLSHEENTPRAEEDQHLMECVNDFVSKRNEFWRVVDSIRAYADKYPDDGYLEKTLAFESWNQALGLRNFHN